MSGELATKDTVYEWYTGESLIKAVSTVNQDEDAAKRLGLIVYKMHKTNPQLSKFSKASILNAMLECAALKLEPILGRCYFIPYGNELQFMLGYQGMLELARRSGVVATANAVFHGDEFDWISGDEERIVHKPNVDVEKTKENLRCVYCKSTYNGQTTYTVMNAKEVEAIRDKSKAKNSGPWKDFYVEMAKKTVVRRAAKYWPLTQVVMDGFERDDRRTFVEDRPAEVSGSDRLNARLGIAKLDEPKESLETTYNQDSISGILAAIESAKTPEAFENVVNQFEMGDFGDYPDELKARVASEIEKRREYFN